MPLACFFIVQDKSLQDGIFNIKNLHNANDKHNDYAVLSFQQGISHARFQFKNKDVIRLKRPFRSHPAFQTSIFYQASSVTK